MTVATPDIRHRADEQTLVDSQGQAWLWVLPLHSWVCDTGARWLLRDRAAIETQFGIPEPPTGTAGQHAEHGASTGLPVQPEVHRGAPEPTGAQAGPGADTGGASTQVMPAVPGEPRVQRSA